MSIIDYRATPTADACYRCGYDLRGIADDQPCPECGLLARRSRRPTDELHNSRPRWLRRISRGANLILLAILIAAVWPFLWPAVLEVYYWTTIGTRYGFTGFTVGFAAAAILLATGAW